MNWTNTFAYAVGLITTDGNLSKDGRHLEFTSKDLEQVQNFAKALKLTNKISKKSSSFTGEKKYYHIQFGNVKLYRFLVSIGLHPHKSKTLGQLNIPDKYFSHFLRGCLDGDGFTFSYWDKRWRSSFMFYSGFVSASKEFLKWLEVKIDNLYGIRGAFKPNRGSVYQLVYAKKASIDLVQILYSGKGISFLGRKRFKIERALGIIRGQAGML
ncbi:hypothetical protein HY502_01280 [Candidatus Woesebacteria bacterium]|nr:hypothetical protein [Candidatus Woesebacteria bacterium]